MIHHLFCTFRDRALRLLLGPCPCRSCVLDREAEWHSDELTEDAESYANGGWEL